jgi:hypothetical protein
LTQLNVGRLSAAYPWIAKRDHQETEMIGLAKADTATEQLEIVTRTDFAQANERAWHFIFGVQRAMLDEVVFAATELLDRSRTETHLFGEFVSKMAGSHSVRDIKMMCRECWQHQLDFLRRDSERVFRHGGRLLETTSVLFSELTHS